VTKTVNGSTTAFMYDGADVVADYVVPAKGTYTPTRTYLQGLGIDSKFTQIEADASKTTHYYDADALGSVHQVIDGFGQDASAQELHLRTAWGEDVAGGASMTRYSFTQRENDDESELVYFRARHYSPKLGRFVQKDKLYNNLTHYIYSSNNYIRYIDPMGLDPIIKTVPETGEKYICNCDPGVLGCAIEFWTGIEGSGRNWFIPCICYMNSQPYNVQEEMRRKGTIGLLGVVAASGEAFMTLTPGAQVPQALARLETGTTLEGVPVTKEKIYTELAISTGLQVLAFGANYYVVNELMWAPSLTPERIAPLYELERPLPRFAPSGRDTRVFYAPNRDLALRDIKEYGIDVFTAGRGRVTTAVPEGEFIWVQKPSGEFVFATRVFYKPANMDRFPHTILGRGGCVLGAGEGFGRCGNIEYVNFRSGHYRPRPEEVVAKSVDDLIFQGLAKRSVLIDLTTSGKRVGGAK
jgi:RHS repeat-associated protein